LARMNVGQSWILDADMKRLPVNWSATECRGPFPA
jgi:hypothetical protein